MPAISILLLVLLTCATFVIAGCGAGIRAGATAPNPSPLAATQETGRGVFFFQLSGNANGADEIVGTNNTAAERKMVSNLLAWGINTVYGSYDTIIAAHPSYVQSWNTLLSNNGIKSYVMLSSTTDFLPSYWSSADTWLWANFLTFNSETTASSQKFVGVMLDVEPEAFAGDANNLSWNATTNAGRRTYVGDLLTFIQAYRTLINDEVGNDPIATTLTTWFPNLNQTIGWANQADVNSWFSSLGAAVNHVSIMDYETSSVSLIESRYTANAALLPAGETTIALDSLVSSGWSSFSQMWSAMLSVESAESLHCDIDSYDTLATDEGQ
jgi:hypothetical protein